MTNATLLNCVLGTFAFERGLHLAHGAQMSIDRSFGLGGQMNARSALRGSNKRKFNVSFDLGLGQNSYVSATGENHCLWQDGISNTFLSKSRR